MKQLLLRMQMVLIPLLKLPNLYKEFSKGFDMVVGQRTGENFRESLMKSSLRSLLKFVVEFAAGKRIPDINSGMRIFKKKTIKEYAPNFAKHLASQPRQPLLT